jgi:hypothetical protein
MIKKDNNFSFSFRGLLVLAAVAILMVMLPTTVAAQGGGNTPTLAVTLADDVNEGSLNPLEQHWYKFTPAGANVEQTLYLIISPDDGSKVRFVTLKVFEGSQIQFFSNGDAGGMAVFAAGQLATRDGNPNTGERFWAGTVSAPTTYYVQIFNESDFPVDYQLFNTATSPEVEQAPETPQAAETPAQPQPETPAAAPPEIVAKSNDPGLAEELVFDERGRVTGRIAPNAKYWYTISPPNVGNDPFQAQQYTLFFTPDDGNRRHNVTFELFPYSEFDRWQRGDGDTFTNFGAGMIVDRDGDYLTGERLWNGTLIKGDKYLLSIANGNDIPIDFYFYNGDITNDHLGEIPAPPPAPVYALGAAPQTAAPLKLGENEGLLQPGEEAWFSFSIADLDNEKFEEMALTMVSTPLDGNLMHHVTFDVFTAGGVKNWSPGDNSQIRNLGAGALVTRDNNDLTGERFWKGWVNDGDLYYVQIRNGTGIPVDYHLFTGDVYGPELGEPTVPVVRTYDPGTAPANPVPLALGVNKNQLKPGEERWYTFSRLDAPRGERVDTIFTMVFTPDDGNRRHRVNFELYEGNALRDWAPDNRFTIVPFGKGAQIERDNSLTTGEKIWNGQVFAGDTYYMRVFNESNTTIDFYIFPEDVIAANLEEVQ